MPARKAISENPTPKEEPFDYLLDVNHTDLRRHPEIYRIGKGEQGALLVADDVGNAVWRVTPAAKAATR